MFTLADAQHLRVNVCSDLNTSERACTVLDMDISKATAKLVGEAISASGKTVTDVASAMNTTHQPISRQTLSRRLAGEGKTFTATEIYTIAGILGVPASSLLPKPFFKDAA